VRGLDLAHVITRDGPLPWSRAAPLFVQLCGALQEAHELGIVHRDLKPENVLITRTSGGRDYAKVLDFGLAKLEQQRAPTTETGRQQVVGTPYFMSPEQIRGDEVDARTDIYSMGTLMFEVLTGQHLFNGSTAVGVLTKHLTAEPDAPSMRAPNLGIDPRVDQMCLRALAKERDQRWRTAAELAEAIEEVFAETVETATGPGTRAASRRVGTARLALPVEDHATSDLRLRRSDIDAFERGMRVRRYLMWSIAGAIVLGGAGAATWAAMREPPPLSEEREPNDDVAHANKIAAGERVTGYLGKRRSSQEGDRDCFVVPWAAGTKRIVTVRVTGIPNMAIELGVADGDGQHGAVASAGGTGDGEVLHRRAIDGPLVITVTEKMAKDATLPVENVSDPYTLTVTEEPEAGGETEPNNTDPDATPLEPTRELRGYLDYREDVDVLRWTGGDGSYDIVVRADGIPLVWRLADDKLRTPGAASDVALHHGDLLRLERTDRDGSGPLVGREGTWSIVATPHPH
jgi:serine/threonine-protein kinase